MNAVNCLWKLGASPLVYARQRQVTLFAEVSSMPLRSDLPIWDSENQLILPKHKHEQGKKNLSMCIPLTGKQVNSP